MDTIKKYQDYMDKVEYVKRLHKIQTRVIHIQTIQNKVNVLISELAVFKSINPELYNKFDTQHMLLYGEPMIGLFDLKSGKY